MYFNRDYESIRSELLNKIPQLTDRWTDFNPTDPGIVLLDLFCGIADMLGYYLDAQAAEAFLPTARQRQSVIDLCKLIGYRLKRPIAATTTLQFGIAAPLDQDLTIPAGTICRALTESGTIDFETVEDVGLIRGANIVNISARQGIRKSEQFETESDNRQPLELLGKNIAENSIRVQIDGQYWMEVDHFQESDSVSTHFVSSTDATDKTTIRFGDGRNGMLPTPGTLITVDWLETLGAQGNLPPNRINQLLTSIYLNKVQISLTVNNPVPATGGAAAESLEQARKQAPAQLRTLWKAVTLEDYQTLAAGFPGVAKAKVLDTNSCSAIRYYKVHLVIAPHGGYLPSKLLKKELLSFLEQRKTLTTEVKIFDPVYHEINVDAIIYYRLGEQADQLRNRLEKVFNIWLSFDKVEFGQPIYQSDIIALLDGVSGVSHLELLYPKTDILLSCGELPVAGKISLDLRRAD